MFFFVVFIGCSILSGIMEGGGGISSTPLTAPVGVGDVTLHVVSTDNFLDADYVVVGDEEILYSGVAGGNSFTGCTRGYNGTEAKAHNTGTMVYTTQASAINNGLNFNVAATVDTMGWLAFPAIVIQFFTKTIPQLVMWNFSFLQGDMMILGIFFFASGAALIITLALMVLEQDVFRKWWFKAICIALILGIASLFIVPKFEVTVNGTNQFLSLSLGTNKASASPTTITNSPSINSGSWTSPTNAYADGGGYADITSGTPSSSQVYGNFGFNLAGSSISQVRIRYDAWSGGSPLTITLRAAGANATGTTSVVTSQPTGTQTNDVLIAFIVDHATYNGQSVCPTGWQPRGYTRNSAGRRFQIFSAVKGANGLTGTSWTWSGLTTRSQGVIIGYYNVDTTGYGALDTNVSVRDNASGTYGTTGITTVTNGDMIVAAFGSYVAASTYTWANESCATIGTLTERFDNKNSTYCSIAIADKLMATAGATGNSTATPTSGQNNGGILLALKPQMQCDDQIRVDVSWDGGVSWSAKQVTNLTGSEATYWYDITNYAYFTPENLNNGELQVQIDAITVGDSSDVRLDWVAVEVTSTTEPIDNAVVQDMTNAKGTVRQVTGAKSTAKSYSATYSVADLNYIDNLGVWQPINIHTSPTSNGWVVRGGQYCVEVDTDGSRKIYPDTRDKTKYIQFGAPDIFTGLTKTLSDTSIVMSPSWGTMTLKFTNDIIGFDVVFNQNPLISTIAFPITAVGYDISSLLTSGNIPPVHLIDSSTEPIERYIDWVYAGGNLSIILDFSGMVFPVTLNNTTFTIGASADDGRTNEDSGNTNTTLAYVSVIASTTKANRYWGGFRFTGTLPSKLSTILTAITTINESSSTYDDVFADIYCEDVAGGIAFTEANGNFDITGRTKTTQSVLWSADAIVSPADSPSLVDPIQEIVTDYTLTSIVLIWQPRATASKSLRILSQDNGSGSATLTITWNEPAGYSLTNTGTNPVAFGIKAQGSTLYAKGTVPHNPVTNDDCTFTITNDGSSTEKIQITGADFAGGVGAALIPAGDPPGEDEVRVTAYYYNIDPGDGIVLTTSPQDFIASLAASATIKWDFMLELGQCSETPPVAKSGTITLTAVAP